MTIPAPTWNAAHFPLWADDKPEAPSQRAPDLVFFSIIPDIMIAAIPTKYAEVATHAEPPKTAPATMEINGILAPQGINVVVMMVMRRSRSFSMVLEAIMPGIPQPVPISMGMKDFPDRPNFRKTRSRTKAIRAI